MNPRVDEAIDDGDALRTQARVWLRLLTSTQVKAYDTDGFQRWLQASPAHKEAFREARRHWDALEPASRAFLQTHPGAAEAHRRALHGTRPDRRAFLGAAVGAAAVAGVAGMAVAYPPARLWRAPAEWGADDRTATGEQRTLVLADRVQVMLNTQTSVRRGAGGDSNAASLELITGEAAIDLPAGGASFAVTAGAGRSSADAGRFEVRNLDGKVCVTCVAGAVQVVHPAGTRTLKTRQQAVYDAHALSGVASVDPASMSAWRRGELVFDEARLSDVIAEINRYRAGRVVLMRRSAQDSRISGRFLIASLDSVFAQLQQMFALRVRTLPGGLVLLG